MINSTCRTTSIIVIAIVVAVIAVCLYIINVKPKTITTPEPAPVEVVEPVVDNAVETVVAPIDATKITQ